MADINAVAKQFTGASYPLDPTLDALELVNLLDVYFRARSSSIPPLEATATPRQRAKAHDPALFGILLCCFVLPRPPCSTEYYYSLFANNRPALKDLYVCPILAILIGEGMARDGDRWQSLLQATTRILARLATFEIRRLAASFCSAIAEPWRAAAISAKSFLCARADHLRSSGRACLAF